jgi:hydroxymethylbilane synthase
MQTLLRIGARASPLSLAQARHVRAMLAAALHVPPEQVDALLPITPMTTTGDRITEVRLLEAGGKGLFTKELDEALLDGRIDAAVHSMKDLPTQLPPGVVLACAPEREDVRDAFLSPEAEGFDALPHGAVLGTASLRRQAQSLHRRPDLAIRILRGNVQTRLGKLAAGEAAATFLAVAGLKRLGLESHARSLLDPEEFPPAVGQGALAITARAEDQAVLDLLARIERPEVRLEIEAERGFLAAAEGSCRTPIAAYVKRIGAERILIGEALTPDGAQRWRGEVRLGCDGVAACWSRGFELGKSLREQAGDAWPRDPARESA